MRTNKMRRLSMQKGFTLLEIIVVIAIIAMLGAVVAPNILDKWKDSGIKKTQIQISGLVDSLDLYELDNKNKPSTEQGLQALVTKPSGSPEPSATWSQVMKKLPVDEWGNPYQYLNPGVNGDVDVYSYGPDGRKSDDDIGSWQL